MLARLINPSKYIDVLNKNESLQWHCPFITLSVYLTQVVFIIK